MPLEVEKDVKLKSSARVVLRRILAMAVPYRGYLAAGVAMGMAMSALNLLRPYIVGSSLTVTLDALQGGRWDWETVRPLVWWLAVLVAVTAMVVTVEYANSIVMVHFRMKILTDLRHQLYRKILGQSFSYFDHQDTGQLINRTIGDVNVLRTFYTLVIVRGAETSLLILGAIGALLVLDWRVAVVAALFIPVYAVAMVAYARRLHPQFHDMRTELDRSTQILSENVQGVQVVRAFGREPEEIKRFETSVRAVLERWIRLAKSFALFQPGITLVGEFGLLAMLGAASYRAIEGTLAVGMIYTVFRWSRMLTDNMGNIGKMTATIQQSLVSAERVFEILDTPAEICQPGSPSPMPEGRGHVVFENVAFGYNDGEPILANVNLDIPAGTNVALVGPTGSGKSSLIKLLPRFYDPKEGRILIDGADIRDLNLEQLRAEIGFVFQDTFLFSASLAENIAFGVPAAERKAIEEAAHRARVDEFAEAFEQGYDTSVGERGISLSGGQRQRVAIARALLMDPRILILDDATASVDAETERGIQDNLAVVMKDRTTFIIAHRATTVKRADLVVVVDGGRIVQQGTHRTLMAEDGPYRDFIQMQWHLGTDVEEGDA